MGVKRLPRKTELDQLYGEGWADDAYLSIPCTEEVSEPSPAVHEGHARGEAPQSKGCGAFSLGVLALHVMEKHRALRDRAMVYARHDEATFRSVWVRTARQHSRWIVREARSLRVLQGDLFAELPSLLRRQAS